MTFLSLLEKTGIVAFPLLICSVVSLTIIFERTIYWVSILRGEHRILKQIEQSYLNDDSHCNQLIKQNNYRPIVKMIESSISGLPDTSEQFERSASVAIHRITFELQKYDTLLTTIITISPLLGLLGTVLGLIKSFSAMTLGETLKNSALVMSGISEALMSTAIGLVIAIITLIFTNIFRNLKRAERAKMQEFASLILFKFEKAEQ